MVTYHPQECYLSTSNQPMLIQITTKKEISKDLSIDQPQYILTFLVAHWNNLCQPGKEIHYKHDNTTKKTSSKFSLFISLLLKNLN